jgi:hypothetical protein
MAGYAYTGQVTDPNAKKALIQAYDLIAALRTEVDALKAAALQRGAAITAGGERLTDLGSPEANGDAVHAGYLKAYVVAQLESFKGLTGVSGTIDTATAQVVTVENGIIVEIA